MKTWLKALIAGIAAAALCLGVIFVLDRHGSDGEGCRIWYVAGDVSEDAIAQLVREYNSSAENRITGIDAVSFESPEAIDAAMKEQRPEILICSYDTAERMAGEGLLTSAGSLSDYPEVITAASPSAGNGFYPFGFYAHVLTWDKEYEPERETLSRLIAWAGEYSDDNGAPGCVIASLWPILAGEADSFTGDIETDRKNDSFCQCYNLLAKGVFDYCVSTDPVDAPCRIVSSRDVKDGEPISPIPGMKAGESFYVGGITGFALICNDSDAVNFLRFAHESGRLSRLAKDSGMEPVDKGSERLPLNEVRFLPYDSEPVRNRHRFERDMSRAFG